ncbi:ribonuclease H [Senna tora]|uniref:Ribonuclease H n=1 Tax=Senna tora TaxID=362788 RepID=A0A835CIQ3_9FABA|nr:ribonuclease H [Senna tora]
MKEAEPTYVPWMEVKKTFPQNNNRKGLVGEGKTNRSTVTKPSNNTGKTNENRSTGKSTAQGSGGEGENARKGKSKDIRKVNDDSISGSKNVNANNTVKEKNPKSGGLRFSRIVEHGVQKSGSNSKNRNMVEGAKKGILSIKKLPTKHMGSDGKKNLGPIFEKEIWKAKDINKNEGKEVKVGLDLSSPTRSFTFNKPNTMPTHIHGDRNMARPVSGPIKMAEANNSMVIKTTRFLIHTKVTDISKIISWFTTKIYGSPQASLQDQLWEDLRTIANGTIEAWILLGDFNAYLSPNDKQGSTYVNWSTLFPDAHVTHLTKLKFDHSPILLSLSINDRSEAGSRPFCFQAAWLSDNSFHTLMENAWCTTGDWGWNWGMIAPNLNNAVKKRIEALIPPHPSHQDCVRWDHETDGNFTMRSAYKAVYSHNAMSPCSLWKKVRRCPVPEQVRTFIWLMVHGKVLTNSHHMHRRMTMDATCLHCGRENEIVIHNLRDCEDIEDVLLRFVKPSYWEQFSLGTWLIGLIGISRLIISDIIAAAENNMKPMASPKVTRMIRWIPTERDRFKCNTDGSVLERVKTKACGGVIRNISELHGIVEGLNLLWLSGSHKVDIETDSSTAISMITQGVPDTHPCVALIFRIQEMCDRDWDMRFRHVYRETNRVADFLFPTLAFAATEPTAVVADRRRLLVVVTGDLKERSS